jgi:hypothetical protein
MQETHDFGQGAPAKAPEAVGADPVMENPLPVTADAAAMAMQLFAAAMNAARARADPQPGMEGGAAAMSPMASPHHSPAASPRSQREPRLGDLASYDGAAGVKLDEWLSNLRRLAGYYDLDGERTVKYGAVHFTGGADLWWTSLDAGTRFTISDLASFSAALRARFQPVTAERTARVELYKLEQGSRGVDAYIAEFQRLCALVPSASEAEKLFQFERGLRLDLTEKLRIQGVTALDQAIALAARVGNLTGPVASRTFGHNNPHPARLHQMEESFQSPTYDGRLERIETALNAMAQHGYGGDSPAGSGAGLGAKTQTHRGYQQQNTGGRGGRRPSSSSRPPRPLPQVAGVPAEVVQHRLTERLCLRCGESGHNSHSCPNPIKSSN